MLPLHDDNPTRHFPLVTLIIIALNVMAFVLWEPTFASGRDKDQRQVTFFYCHAEVPYEVSHQTSIAQGNGPARGLDRSAPDRYQLGGSEPRRFRSHSRRPRGLHRDVPQTPGSDAGLLLLHHGHLASGMDSSGRVVHPPAVQWSGRRHCPPQLGSGFLRAHRWIRVRRSASAAVLPEGGTGDAPTTSTPGLPEPEMGARLGSRAAAFRRGLAALLRPEGSCHLDS